MKNETPLERMLRDAATEPGLRPAFYKRLLDSEVLVPVEPKAGQVANGVIAPGILNVVTLVRVDSVPVIPLYTSPQRVFEASPTGAKCVTMMVRELFACRPDMHFHVNPFSTFGREFTPWEVRSLLDTGGIVVSERIWVPYGGDAKLRPPKDVPERVLAALRVLFARDFDVRAAYVAQHTDLASDERDTLVVALDIAEGGDSVRVLREAGTVITESREPGMPHFAVATLPRDSSVVARYFLEQSEPFYTIGLAGSIVAARESHRGDRSASCPRTRTLDG